MSFEVTLDHLLSKDALFKEHFDEFASLPALSAYFVHLFLLNLDFFHGFRVFDCAIFQFDSCFFTESFSVKFDLIYIELILTKMKVDFFDFCLNL